MAVNSVSQARSTLYDGLQIRRTEIEDAVLARVNAVADPGEANDPLYVEALRDSVSVGLDYGLAAIQAGDERLSSIPAALLAQAQFAARVGVGLDTVLRRYVAGYTVLLDFVMDEAENTKAIGVDAVYRIGRGQAAIFDRLLAAVTQEYTRAAQGRLSSPTERRAERVKRLLAGEFLDASELSYDLNGWHLGAIGAGPDAADALRSLAAELDRRLLLVETGSDDTVWAWLGGSRQLAVAEVLTLAKKRLSTTVTVAVGEAARGLSGWRLTHRQALAALSIALRSHRSVVRYADVALVASVCQDDLLAASLRQMYLDPLKNERDGGDIARKTLRAYFATGRNASSAAALLRVSRRTIANRLRSIEERLGQPLDAAASAIELALSVDELNRDHTGRLRMQQHERLLPTM